MIDTDIDIDMHILHTHVLRLVSCESTVAHAGIVLFWKTVPMGLWRMMSTYGATQS